MSINTILGYSFNNSHLLQIALTHRSVGQQNNERLEYLGDALLGFVVAEILYQQFSDADEGELTRLRASLVKREALAEIGRENDIGKYLILGEGEKKSGGWRRDSILANTIEAIIGAIYLDSDFNTAQSILEDLYKAKLQKISVNDIKKDAKTELQEYLQARKLSLPSYEIVGEEGKAHSKQFSVKCSVQIIDEPVIATGRSKRGAEQAAAMEVLRRLKRNKDEKKF